MAINNQTIQGKVIHGKGGGRKLGFPTLNISSSQELELENGVYACKVLIGAESFNGIMHYGARPTFNEGNVVIEVHVFDFDREVYGQIVTVKVYDFIRGVQKFGNVDALVGQIKKDCEMAKQLLD